MIGDFKRWCFIVFIYFPLKTNAQIILKGSVRSIDNNPIPFAHISISSTALGTISNQDGNFKLNIDSRYEGYFLKVTSIGYFSDSIKIIPNSGPINFKLRESVNELQSVTIYSVDYARKIVEEAIENIPSNYPDQSEYMTVFVRNSNYVDSTMENPNFIIESQLQIEKPSYKKPRYEDNVKILNNRKFEFQHLDSLYIGFHGGFHIPYWGDLIANRTGPLNKSRLDKYDFEITDTIYSDSSAYYLISFDSKSNGRGELKILEKSKAIAEIGFHLNESELSTVTSDIKDLIGSYKRQSSAYRTNYRLIDTLWRLSSISYNSTFVRGEKPYIFLVDEAIVTNYQDLQGDDGVPITYDEIYLHKVGKYDSTFWEGQNILLPTSDLEQLLKEKKLRDTSRIKRTEKILKILSKFESRVSFSYLTVPQFIGSVDFFPIKYHGYSTSPGTNYLLGVNGQLSYKLSQRSFVELKSISPFRGSSYQGGWAAYRYLLRPAQRRFNISPSIGIGSELYRYRLQTYENESKPVSIKGKEFDSNNIKVFFENKVISLFPSLSLQFKRPGLWNFYLEGGYRIKMTAGQGLYFVEDQPFYKRNKTYISERKSSLNIQTDLSSNRTQLFISIGVIFSL